ncbi:histidine phosphatase family protein [Leptolyngbya sp. 'hensonii']|uniref:histidine phosphatase family protein n=1 Tax=Leptolyngbya sp. 'hensonii' TaxID=1922337 RepID=UPI000A8F5D1E|nr:histidine phosphatase family protein [Leptolyngbya sp. 'hensonii']
MLYFLRHGLTAYSLTGGYSGTPENDPGLTPEGLDMAKAFAKAYGDHDWTAIFVSPLRRALQTAKPIAMATGLEIQIRDGLKEITYGDWEGKHPNLINQEFHDDYVRWLADPAWNAPTNGERAVDIARRCGRVIEEIEHTYPNGNVLIVSHKATIRIMLCELMGIDVGRYRDRFAMPVGALSIVELADHGPMFHSLCDRSYLPDFLRAIPST